MKYLLPKNDLSGAGAAVVLVAACSLLVLMGCRDPLDLRDAQRGSETGVIALTIGEQGVGRTIMPSLPGGELRFSINFISTDYNNYNFTATWDGQAIIELQEGEWDLRITSFIPDGGNQRTMAESGWISVVVAPAIVTTHIVVLVPIAEGTGTFIWDVSFPPAVASAEMRILRLENGVSNYVDTLIIHGPDATDETDIELPVGLYRVVFVLSSPNGARAEIGKLLHVYRNMESRFTDEDGLFADFIFPTALLQTVLSAWNADNAEWNFDLGSGRQITYRHFGLLNIGGVDNDNFDDIEDHLTRVTNANANANNVPTTEAGLKALVDAARISIAAENPAFTRATYYWDSDDAEEAITGRAVNVYLEDADFDWTGDYTVTVTVGAYTVDVVFVPVPVTGVRITSPTPAPTDADPYRLEATRSWDFTAMVEPSDARYRGIRWEIPDSAHEDFVEITEYNEVTGTARIYGRAVGLANVYAVSVVNDTHRVRVPIDVFALGAGVPITDIEITNTDPITLEIGDDVNFVIVRTPSGTTQLGITVTSSAPGIVTIDGLRITGVTPGTVTITVAATANPSVYDTITVNVPPTPRTVVVSPAATDVPRNGTQQFNHIVLHGAGGSANVPQGVTWTATPEEYATIDNDGLLTLLPTATIDGTVTVRATTTHASAVYGEATVTVLPPVPETIDITAVDATITGGAITVTMGTPQTFNAIVGPEGALQGVTWSIVPIGGASTAGAGIGSDGVLTTMAPLIHGDMFTVRATVNALPTLSADVTVTINVTPTGINITGYAGEIARGSTATFTAQVLPHPAASQAVNWSVHAYPGYPAVAPTGVTIPGGVLTLTADADVSYNQVLVVRAAVPGTGFVATRQVTVTVIPTSVVIISPTPPSVAAHRGTSLAFAARVEPYSAASQAVVWSVAPAESGAYFIGNILQIPSGLLPNSILTITATAAGIPDVVSAPLTVTVTTPAPTGVQVTPTGVNMGRDDTLQFNAEVLPDGGPGGVAYGRVVWSIDSALAGVTINHYGELAIAADAGVYHGDTFTVRATAYGIAVSGTATVNISIPPTSVTIGQHDSMMVRGTSHTLTAIVGPGGASQNVVWSVDSGDGSFTGNVLTILPGAAETLVIRAQAQGHVNVFSTATIDVLNPGEFDFNIILPAFPGPDIGTDIPGPTISLLDNQNNPVTINVTNSADFNSIRWFFGGIPIGTNPAQGSYVSNGGASLTLGPRIHGNLLDTGTFFLTVEVVRSSDGQQHSRRISFEVKP